MAPGDGTDLGHDRAAQRFPAAPGCAVPPLVPHRVVATDRDDVEAVGPPGNNARCRGQQPAQGLPAAPCGAVPPPVPQPVVLAEREDVKAIGPPRDGPRRRSEDTTEGLPAAPCGAVPPLVPERMVLAEGEDVGPIRAPGGRAWGRGDDAAQRLPACPQERDLRDRVTPNPHTGQHRVVEIAVLLDDGGMIGCSEQAVIAVGHAVDHNELAWQAGRVHVGPADRDALVSARVAAGGSWSGY